MTRIDQEKRTVERMIRLYCRRKEGNGELCPQCAELLAYAHRRLDSCRFGNAKPACKHCPSHCYALAYRERIKQVMRFSGPRLLWFHPISAIRHLLSASPRESL